MSSPSPRPRAHPVVLALAAFAGLITLLALGLVLTLWRWSRGRGRAPVVDLITEEELPTGAGRFIAAPEGDALLWLQGDALVRWRNRQRAEVDLARAPCRREALAPGDLLAVSPWGSRAVVYAVLGALPGALTDRGPRLAAACLVDVDAGTATDLFERLPDATELRSESLAPPGAALWTTRLYLWRGGGPLRAFDLATGRASTLLLEVAPSDVCSVTEADGEAVVACVHQGLAANARELEVTTFSLREGAPSRTAHRTAPIELPEDLAGTVLARGGRAFAYWGNPWARPGDRHAERVTVGVIALAGPALGFSREVEVQGGIAAAAFTHRARGLLILDGDARTRGTLRAWSLEGELELQAPLARPASQLSAQPRGALWLGAPGSARRVRLPQLVSW